MAKKYIDIDLLRKEIEFAKSVYNNPNRVIHGVADAFRQDGRAAMCDDILKKIDSLQQEQPTKGYDEAYLNEKIAKASKTWEGVDVDKYMAEMRGYEQPSEDLGSEIEKYFQGLWPGMETAEQCNTDMHFTPPAIMRLASHFANWGAEHAKKETPFSEDLEKAAESYCVEICNYAVDSLEADTAIDAFIEGAKWQKEQMIRDCSVQASYEAEIEKAEERGYNLCKEQMLKDAVDGAIGYIEECDAHYLSIYDQDELEGIILSHFEEGDKVKIIIIKEDNK